MDEQQTGTSRKIIDRRRATAHGFSGLIGVLIGVLIGRGTGGASDPDRDLVAVTSVAIDRGDDFWLARLPGWRSAHVILIDGTEETACGVASVASGPFYCPKSERIYLDLSFLRAIDGDLARAYVVAHELGHHVQNIRGELTGAPVALELQADCYAGMWMHEESTHGHLDAGDFDAAIAEAGKVGDDRIQPGSSPETWTHGSAAQRVAALRAGFGGGPCSSR